ncbi:MAG TPA: Stp1/IreP family PP2C-type Ser/Thr phosphatase [Clostridia bacterium]
MKFGVKSDRGIIRELNEDSYNLITGYPNVPVCFIIADGMGGHNSGEVASRTAVDSISNSILQQGEALSDESKIQETIENIIYKANSEIYELSKQQVQNSGMGTTLILSVIVNKKLYIGHLGDSRVYVVRDGMMERITTDHSYIEELIKNGSISRQEALNHPQKNLITRALGCFEQIEVDTFSCNVKDNDIFLMCTDGLTNMVDEETIKDILERYDDPEKACEELVREANARGGEDNITVIVFKEEI